MKVCPVCHIEFVGQGECCGRRCGVILREQNKRKKAGNKPLAGVESDKVSHGFYIPGLKQPTRPQRPEDALVFVYETSIGEVLVDLDIAKLPQTQAALIQKAIQKRMPVTLNMIAKGMV